MVKNWFVIALAVMCFIASGYEVIQGRSAMSVVYFAYGVANVALAIV